MANSPAPQPAKDDPNNAPESGDKQPDADKKS